MKKTIPISSIYVSEINTLPKAPGVYLFFDQEDKLLYIGKAKSLHARVAQHLGTQDIGSKALLMKQRICTVRYILTQSELDALRLEAYLIKQHYPPFNIRQESSRSRMYFLALSYDLYPRLYIHTGLYTQDNVDLFGPFYQFREVKQALDLLQSFFKIRNCNNQQFQEQTLCVYYELMLCSGPCENKISIESYVLDIQRLRRFFNGEYDALLDQFKSEMHQAVHDKKYILAAIKRDHIIALQSLITNLLQMRGELHVIGIASLKEQSCIVLWVMKEEQVVHSYERIVTNVGDQEVFNRFLSGYVQTYSLRIPILVPSHISLIIDCPPIPNDIDQQQLLHLAEEHANNILAGQIPLEQRFVSLEKAIFKKLNHIICVDISHISGEHVVAAFVKIFRSGVHRVVYINLPNEQNDCLSISRAVETYLQQSNQLPDCLILDGGRGQLSSVIKVTQSQLHDRILAIAKEYEKVYFWKNNKGIRLNLHADALGLLTKARDLAHKHGISYSKNSNEISILKFSKVK